MPDNSVDQALELTPPAIQSPEFRVLPFLTMGTKLLLERMQRESPGAAIFVKASSTERTSVAILLGPSVTLSRQVVLIIVDDLIHADAVAARTGHCCGLEVDDEVRLVNLAGL